ncbi:hypothetical protein J5I95_17300 [Candidatus Poribacteria bacterium]|nr:hypothetical protein [Candidatus Poribacteria bacterium]
MRHWIKLYLVAFLMLGISSPQSSANSKSKALAESGLGKRIVQRLKQSVGKHIDLKKPAALAMAVWMLNGAPVQAEQNPLHSGSQHALQQSAGEQELANIDADWELLQPKQQGEKDVANSFVYLDIELRPDPNRAWVTMHLSYLGKSADGEHLFLGMHFLKTIGLENEVVRDQAVPSLVGREGLIKKNIDHIDIIEVKHIPHPEDPLYDLTILAIKDVDMAGYEPIAIAKYPAEGTDLEMYSFILNHENFRDVFNYPLGKRTCTAGNFNAAKGLGINNCLISFSPAVMGSPIIDADSKHLVALYAKQEEIGDGNVLTAFSVATPVIKLEDLDLEGYAVEPDDTTIVTTWAQIKSLKRK